LAASYHATHDPIQGYKHASSMLDNTYSDSF